MNYGQSFLCISVDNDQFNSIGKQLMYNEITAYRRNIPATFAAKFPILTDAANQKRIRQAPFTSKTLLKSSGGVEFVSFAKSDKWQQGNPFLRHFYIPIYRVIYKNNYKNIYKNNLERFLSKVKCFTYP